MRRCIDAVARAARQAACLVWATALLTSLSGAASAQESASPAQIERGQYLAIAGNCSSCHTASGGDYLAGGVAFDTDFGTIYSTNISPDMATGIGAWTAEEFRRAMREGVSADGTHLYPVFPYTHYTRLTDEDIEDLFAYLKSVPAASEAAGENDVRFPYSIRGLMRVWNLLFLDTGPMAAVAGNSAEWERGRYLVEGLGHCSACHTPRNFLGAERESMAMTGAMYVDEVSPGKRRPWFAANLTSADDGLGAWSVEEIDRYLQQGHNSFVRISGPMRKVVMDSTQQLTAADTRAMAVYLESLPANSQDPGPEPDAAVVRRGNTLYTVNCGTCHLPTGLGETDAGWSLVNNPTVQAANPASLINIILHGPLLPDPPLPADWDPMEAFADKLRNEDVAAIATFLRSSWGNTGGLVTPEQVAAQR